MPFFVTVWVGSTVSVRSVRFFVFGKGVSAMAGRESHHKVYLFHVKDICGYACKKLIGSYIFHIAIRNNYFENT